MRIVIAGGMTLAVNILAALRQVGVEPVGLIGYPPGLSHRSNYASLASVAQGVPLVETSDINSPEVRSLIGRETDWLLVAGWSQLVHPDILEACRLGALGFHMSKLPEGRGRAPVAWTLIKGLSEAWVTLQWLRAGADEGDIALQSGCPVEPFDDAATLVTKVNAVACEMMVEALPMMKSGILPRRAQDAAQATYWERRKPVDGLIDWSSPAQQLYDFIRGITWPFPGAFTFLEGKRVIVWAVGVLPLKHDMDPGFITGGWRAHGKDPEAGIGVAAVGGLLVIRSLQRDEDPMPVRGAALAELADKWAGWRFSSSAKNGAPPVGLDRANG